MEKDVKAEWDFATKNFPRNVCDSWWNKIHSSYNDEGRNAHNLICLHKKIRELNNFRERLANANAFILALFFQYLNYNPKDADLYAKNLESFEEFSKEAGLSEDDETHRNVQDLLEKASISSTEENKVEGAFGENDIHYFIDLDMITLGSNQEEYSQHTKDIALEYSFLDSASFKMLRKRILQSFLLIPNIFATKLFRNKYEEQARRNIQNELDELT